MKCPKCQSSQLTAQKKGFSGKKAVAGALLTGGVGLLAGTIGQNDIEITCLSCGNKWEPGKKVMSESELNKPVSSGGKWALVFLLACVIACLYIIFG